MPEKSNEELRAEAHWHGNEALRLFDEAKQLHQEADLIKDDPQHHEAMKLVHRKDAEAVAHLRESNKLGAELARRHKAAVAKQLQDLQKD